MGNKDMDWVLNRVQHIKGLSKPTEHQVLMVALVEATALSADDEKALNALVRLERAKEALKSAEVGLVKINSEQEEKARKRRARVNFLLGERLLIALREDKGIRLWFLKIMESHPEGEILETLSPLIGEIKALEAVVTVNYKPVMFTEREYLKAVETVRKWNNASQANLKEWMNIGRNKACSMLVRMEKEGLVSATDHFGKRILISQPANQ